MKRKNKFSKGRFNLRYLTKEGFRNIHVHKLMTVASVTVMLSCLLLIGGAYLIYVNIQSVIDRVGEQNVIMVFIEDSATDDEEAILEGQIKSIPNVKNCELVPREESYESILYDMGETATVLEGIDSSFLPDAYKVTIDDMEQFGSTVSSISALDNVLTVRENGELAQKLASIQNAVSLISVAIVAILLIVSLFIIANTVRITMFSRSLEISIMKAVGATNWFIRAPFLLEGIIIGLISAIVSSGIVALIYAGVIKVIGGEVLAILSTSLVPLGFLAFNLVWIFIALGVSIGAWGSMISMRRFLDTK